MRSEDLHEYSPTNVAHFFEMTKYNSDYAFISKDDDAEGFPFLKLDSISSARFEQTDSLATGYSPLIFRNGHEALYARRGIKEKMSDVLFEGATFIVRDAIREALMPLELPGVHFQPAVYIDGGGGRHEDYWYVTILRHINCVDHAKSTLTPPRKLDGKFTVLTCSLDATVLDAIALHERRLFRMGGTADGLVVCHCSLFEHFRHDGVLLDMIEDY
ncbi:hypothetical protein KY495_09830 [Massilia sp. PAMC28688]|uniref:imm11 family protein n=1 Tax=Massilia sp. PAMC28688 TaxID=2861283 RepID=UPI001C6257F0|nr:DUF1629 domain-containing protein [Massilia sp. PAMC28688]QYF95418.1 hypothetical protein KY495_09830 [Massilia sp. PAMC28688]